MLFDILAVSKYSRMDQVRFVEDRLQKKTPQVHLIIISPLVYFIRNAPSLPPPPYN